MLALCKSVRRMDQARVKEKEGVVSNHFAFASILRAESPILPPPQPPRKKKGRKIEQARYKIISTLNKEKENGRKSS